MMAIALSIFLILYVNYFDRPNPYKNKNILIIGATTGLGNALKNILSKYANVTTASRSDTLKIDVTNISSFTENNTEYDYIFCCAGFSKPGYFEDQIFDIEENHSEDVDSKNIKKAAKEDPYKQMIETNYLGTINALKHYYKNNIKPFKFVMVGSTVSLFSFPGYSAYAPSKAALKSFYESVKDEMENTGIELYIYYAGGMKSPGYKKENITKPEFTKLIEGSTIECEEAAEILLESMLWNREITGDFITRMFLVMNRIENIYDLLLLPIAIVVVNSVRLYIRIRYSLSNK